MTMDQESISRLTDLILSGDYYTIFSNTACDCARALRAALSEIERKFFWDEKNRHFHVAVVTSPLMIIYCLKKSLLPREALAELIGQELPENFDIFSMRDESSPEFLTSEKEILDAVAEEDHLRRWGVVGQ